jgi:mannose-6-phosphate isomerase
VERLENVIQRYAWGHQTAIPELLGIEPDGLPHAELWLGAHPSAPSKLSSGLTLDAHIAQAPERILGAATTKHFGPRLPFLFKVLAAGQPLSLQAHPTLAQAKEGFAREDAAGLARTAANRNYKDPNHKPEIICALTPFRALCGFRRLSDSVRLFEGLGLDVSRLSKGLKGYFEYAMTLSREAQGELVDRLVAGAGQRLEGFEAECELALKLNELYPRDIGIVGALLLNLVELKPGEALYLDAGNLHAYLQGTGVELMANSDNVLRGGLTPKHVDVPQLLSVLDFADGPANVLRATGADEAVYVTPAPDFRLSRVELSDRSITLPARGAQVLLVVEGLVTVKGVALRRGESVFIGADEGDIPLSGNGVIFRATAGVS